VSDPVMEIMRRFAVAPMILGVALLKWVSTVVSEEVHTIRSLFTDELTVYMEVPPDDLWREIKSMYVDGEKFRREGFTVDRIVDDPGVYLGGIRISRTNEQGAVEIRVARFSAIDEESRFLALRADYSEGISVYASYQVRPEGGGSTFQLIAHGEVPVTLSANEELTQASVRKAMAPVIAQNQRYLRTIWEEERTRIEGEIYDR